MLRFLHRLAKGTNRPLPSEVAALMNYLPTAVATGYLRQLDIETWVCSQVGRTPAH
ncbi:hypothetical protein [Streptomyces sp. NPDC002490]|uniref:hypothetical protein n=1 Tax=Streptomyces sp. NPDC002490 TaxID=3154416 RepID=UPI003324FBD8